MIVRGRRSRRKRSRARKNRDKLKEFVTASGRGAEWIMLFLGSMVSLAAALVAFLAGAIVYAVLFFLFGLFVGAALLKRESR